MRAEAVVVAEAGRLPVLRGEPPLTLRATPDAVYVVGTAAGPLGGDDLHLHLEVRENAVLRIRSAAAQLALPGHRPGPSRMSVTATVAPGARLEWLPEPLILGHRADHRVSSIVDLCGGATLLWREELICGRHDEPSGDGVISFRAEYAGRPLLVQSLDVGPHAPGWDGPAVLDGARASGSLLRVDASIAWPGSEIIAPTAVGMPLAGPGWLVTATAPDAHTLRAYLTR
ncbi:urease accessory protein UreD [Hamadaea tsunoensis]|uniref:urease accessory protein UreD n=1 Tax=Hamadaea tsunoensis TaxID=53368 RepID=UPI000418139E|nr:urease accessory protein UreD [Hamadaea tsunoensis]